MGLYKAVHALNVGNIAHEITVSYNLIDFKFATSWKLYSSLEAGKYVVAKLSFARGKNKTLREEIPFLWILHPLISATI